MLLVLGLTSKLLAIEFYNFLFVILLILEKLSYFYYLKIYCD